MFAKILQSSLKLAPCFEMFLVNWPYRFLKLSLSVKDRQPQASATNNKNNNNRSIGSIWI